MFRYSRTVISRLHICPRHSALVKCVQPKVLQNSRQISTCQILLRFANDRGFILDRPSFDNTELPTINKNILQLEDALIVDPEEINKFREESRIKIVKSTAQSVPNPIFDFSHCQLPEKTIKSLSRNGIEKPMPIQAQGMPIAMSGHDMIAIGETGSGKTLGFLIPAIQHTLRQNRADFRQLKGPQVLIVAPTRELAQQTEQVAKKYGSSSGLITVSVYGGANRMQQINALRRGVDIIVATPGRMLDLLETGGASLERTSFVVLDEADRMLDMGFEPQIRQVLDQVRPDRQLLMWSATWPSEVENLAHDFFNSSDQQNTFVHLNIGSIELQANSNIEQQVHIVHERRDKVDKILDLLTQEIDDPKDKVLVFAATKKSVDFLEMLCRKNGIKATAIHGDKSQQMRDRALYNFRNGNVNILIATDVASRGLDVDDVKMVVNYDMPTNTEDYVHRIGRTGRRGKSGKAQSYIVPSEVSKSFILDLIQVMKEADQEVPQELMDALQQKKFEANALKRSRYSYSSGGQRDHRNYSHRGPAHEFDSYDRRPSFSRYGNNHKSSYDRSFQQRQRERSPYQKNAYDFLMEEEK